MSHPAHRIEIHMNLKLGTNLAIGGLSLYWLIRMNDYTRAYLDVQERLKTASVLNAPQIPWNEWVPNIIGHTAMVFGLLSFLSAVRNSQS